MFKRASFDLSLTSKNAKFNQFTKIQKEKQKKDNNLEALEAPGSPFIDVEALSDEDTNQSQKLNEQAEDQRVLTLAEQFLAAMPARIKGRVTRCGDF